MSNTTIPVSWRMVRQVLLLFGLFLRNLLRCMHVKYLPDNIMTITYRQVTAT